MKEKSWHSKTTGRGVHLAAPVEPQRGRLGRTILLFYVISFGMQLTAITLKWLSFYILFLLFIRVNAHFTMTYLTSSVSKEVHLTTQ